MRRTPFADISYNAGYNVGRQKLDRRLDNTSAEGSSNNLLLGEGISQPFGGYDTKGANTGSRYLCQLGKVWGGLKDIMSTLGAGSLFEDAGKSLWFIGAGQVHKEGTSLTGLVASSILQVSVPASGVYSAGNTFDAGMPQPSAADIGIPLTIGSGYTGTVDGAVSAKIVGLRLKTGGASRPSTTSAVVVPSRQTIRITFPTASDGQDNWAVFFTQMGFGGVGLHFRTTYNGALDIPEATVAAGVVDGIARSLEFEFQDGDLSGREIAEVSYIDNYAPPAGTHACRLENVMNVLGCYADSVTNPTSTNPGTCIAVSLPNFYESYKPRHLLFLPEQVVDVLARPSDSYAWVGMRNSIATLQYTGRTDAPACTIAIAFPNIGIAYQHNWVQFYGRIAMFTTKGSLVVVDEEGNLDETIGAPIRKLLKSCLPESTILGFDFETQSLILGSTDFTISYSIENKLWSDPCYLKDSNVTGNVLSCTTSAGKLIVSVANGSAHTAYDYNKGATLMPTVKVSNWRGDSYAKNIYEIMMAANVTKSDYPVAVALQRNLRPTFARACSMTNGDNDLLAGVSIFRSGESGDKVFVYAQNIGGAGVHYLQGKIGEVVNGTTVSLVTEAGAPLNAQATTANAFALFGDYLGVFTPAATGEQHFENLFPNVTDARSYALSVWMMTNAQEGSIFNAVVSGTMEVSSAASVS